MNEKMQQCIKDCTTCYQVCIQTVQHCLKLGGDHAAPDHIRLLLDCSDLCKTSIDLMLRQSPYAHQLCDLCAAVCEACAADCEDMMGSDEAMKACAQACRDCARSCRAMHSMV